MKLDKFISFLFISMIAITNSYGQFEEDENYKRWRIHHTQSLYRPAEVSLDYGKYSIETRPMRGYKIGFEYYFRKTKKVQFYTGLNMNFIPLDNYSYELPGNELGLDQKTFFDNTFRQIRAKHNILSFPLGIQIRKSLVYKVNIFCKAGVNLDFIQYGEYSKNFEITNSGNV